MSNTMREILFRGKRVDNGEWVSGSVLSFDDGGKVILPSAAKAFKEHGTTTICCNECYDVYPETVGQYTGLTDKNGNKIFEGDILRAVSEDTGEPIYAVVGYGKFNDPNSLDDDSIIGWYAEFRGIKTTILNGESEGCSIPSACEVVSNIHDNPELLEGSNE